METGGHHVAYHQRTLERHPIRYLCRVHFDVVDKIVLSHHSVLAGPDPHALAKPAGVLVRAVLYLQRAPVRSGTGNDNYVTDLVFFASGAQLDYSANALVPKYAVVACIVVSLLKRYMNVRGARRNYDRLQQSFKFTWFGDVFLNKSHAFSVDNGAKTFHFHECHRFLLDDTMLV